MSTVVAPSERIAKQRSLKTLAVKALAETVEQQAEVLNYLRRITEEAPADDVAVYQYNKAAQAFSVLNSIRADLKDELA
jgi:phosphomevalonate kinase